MRAFVLTAFVLQIVSLVLLFVILAVAEYPRTTKWERWEDVLAVVIGIGMAAWAASVL